MAINLSVEPTYATIADLITAIKEVIELFPYEVIDSCLIDITLVDVKERLNVKDTDLTKVGFLTTNFNESEKEYNETLYNYTDRGDDAITKSPTAIPVYLSIRHPK